MLPLSNGLGLDLLDQALRADAPVAVAVHADQAGLRAMAGTGTLAPLWHGLVRVQATAPQAAPAAGGWRQQLDGLAEAGQQQLILDLIRAQAAAVLGHHSGEAVRPSAAFRDLGFDSLTAIELRNRLAAATGLRLPATLAFDQPTPQTLARWLRTQLAGTVAATAAAPVLAELDKLEEILSAASPDDLTRIKVSARLQMLLSKLDGSREAIKEPAEIPQLESASDDEIISFINKELGI
jgi:acyl carrier protein